MVFPLLALIIEERGGTSSHTAAAFIAFKLATFFTTPLCSLLLSRYGLQKWTIIPCVLVTTFAHLILVLAQDPYLSIAGMAVWGCAPSSKMLSKTYFATTLPPDLASYYVGQNYVITGVSAIIAPFFGGFLFSLGDSAPFIAALILWLSSVAFAVSNVKVAAPNLFDEPSSDTSEGTPQQDDPTFESCSFDTLNARALENNVSRRAACPRGKSTPCNISAQFSKITPYDEEESLDTIKEECVSDNIADSQPVAQSSNEPQFGSYVIVATFMAGGLFCTITSTILPFLMLYAREKFNASTVEVSFVITVGELSAFLLTNLLQQKPNLRAPGGLLACVGLVPSLLLQYFSKEEQPQSTSFEGFGLFVVGVVLTLIVFQTLRLQFVPILLRHVNRDQAAMAFGKHKCALMLGDVIGMLLGSVVWEWNWKCILLVPAIPLTLCIFSILFGIYCYSRASSSEDTCDVVPDHKPGKSVDVLVTMGSDAKLCGKPDSAHRPKRRSSVLLPFHDKNFDDILWELEAHSLEAAKSKFVEMRDRISELQSLLRAVMPSAGQNFNYERIPQGRSHEEARASVHMVSEAPSATRSRRGKGVQSRRTTRIVFTDLEGHEVEQRHSKSVRQSFFQQLGADSFS
ncbi:hypothetical protein CYMTET_33575 [Cymbomonas tetramitiformis]|uniref:Uncharacterized protein n=1 Tax=Cymbomonas tetramitiformis TaxID=36881 RepID=A0AAE0FCS6_9CHLO|nr:hypothetical protein CYMTET_33575 [Cymbomonas tetramitiformis]